MASIERKLTQQWLPFLSWRRQWREHGIRGDVIAGITVALVMIPQALAYAQLASLPPYIGLYACVLPAIVAALFGSCAQLSTGPVALTALLTGASLMPFARPDSPEFLTLAVLLALMSGLIQLGLGALRLGWLLNLLSRSVMTGFINAAALLICLSQVPALLGLGMERSDHFLIDFWHLIARLGSANPWSLLFGLGSFVCLLLLRRIAPKLPGVLLVVAAATVVSAMTGYAERGGAVIGEIPAGLPLPSLPVIDWGMALALLPAAFIIGLVSFMEATSSATLITGRTGEKWQQNQELIGQGIAKIASAFSGSMPVSASFSRSALNFATGARTGLSSLISVGFVVLTLLYLTPLLWHMPNAALAAVILLVVSSLLDFKALRRAWQASRDDGIASAATFVTTLAFAPNIQIGIMTGLLLSLSLMLYRDMQPRTVMLGLHPDGTYRDLERFGLEHPHPRLVVLRFDSPLTFVTSEAFEKAALEAVQAQPNVAMLMVSGTGINAIDASGLHAISSLQERLRTEGRTLAFCGLKKQIIDPMERTGLWERLKPHAHYRTVGHALDVVLPLLGPIPEQREGDSEPTV